MLNILTSLQSIFINTQIQIWRKAGSQLLLGAAQGPPKLLVPNSFPAWHLRFQFCGPGMSKMSVSFLICSGRIKPEPFSQPTSLAQEEEPAFQQDGEAAPSKRHQRGWTGHPFCRQAKGSEHNQCKICLFPTSIMLWTLSWVSSAINTSLKGRCSPEHRKLKKRLGELCLLGTAAIRQAQKDHVVEAE